MDGAALPARPPGGWRPPGSGPWPLYDTVIDFIDVATGQVVARQRFQGTFYFTSRGDVYRPSVSATGVIGAEVFEVEQQPMMGFPNMG